MEGRDVEDRRSPSTPAEEFLPLPARDFYILFFLTNTYTNIPYDALGPELTDNYEDRARLFEPYVTTRAQGTGLGLPIVKKIIEEHGGTLTLSDADPFDASGHRGARADIRLPRLTEAEAGEAEEMAV